MQLSDNKSERKRTAHCPVCQRAVDALLRGRQRRYCSNACRQQAARDRNPRYEIAGKENGHAQDLNSQATVSRISLRGKPNDFNGAKNAKTGSSLFANGPLNLLGGGSWRWPEAAQLDGKTLVKIRHSEIGGDLILPPDGGES